MNINTIKDIVVTQLVENGIISEQYIEHPFKVKPKEIEAFLKKYPQVEKSMKPFVSARIMQGYRKWINWKNKNEDKLGGTPKHVSSPSFGEKTFYKHDFGNIQGWAAIFQYITAKQLKDPSLYSSKNESINETTKAELDKRKEELLKKVNMLVDKKEKLYSKVDITSSMSADEKKLNKEIADLFSQINNLTRQKRKLSEGKFAEKVKKAELAHSKGNSKLAKYHLDNAQTFMFGLASTEIGKNKEYLNKYKEMRKIYKESVNESTNTPMMSKSGKDIFVDTTFVQLSNKFGTLEHIWMGDFVVKTKDGDVEFRRANKQIDGFSGRVHKVYGDPKVIASLIKNMKPKVVKESVNEASRRATDFYGDSKHGKALHSLLKGKWDSKKVEKFLDKLGNGNDVKYARLIDFISGDIGLNIRKYKTIGEQLPELMKALETLYTDFLTESITEGKYSNRADAMNAFFKGKISGKELDNIAKNDFNGAIATKGELAQFLKNSFMQDVMADQYGIPKSTLVKKVKELLPIVESINERTTKKIKAGAYKGSSEIEALLRSGKWRLIGRNGDEYELMMIEGLTEATITSIPQFNLESDAYIAMLNMLKNNSKFKKIIGTSLLAYMSGGNPKNILTSLRGMLARGVVTNKLINGTVTVLNKRTPRISVSSQQASTPKIIDQFSGVLAAGLLFDFRENTIDMAKLSGDKNVINTANDFSANRGKEKFKTMMGNKLESVVDTDGMQRAGVALPQTEEEPIEESTNEPKIIAQLRDVVKNGYKKLKDPKSGKVMTVDSYSASAIVKVYDALNPTNKEKFANAGLLGMQSMAFKLIK